MDIDPDTNTPEILERKKQDQRLMNMVMAFILGCFLVYYFWQFIVFKKFNILLYIIQVTIMVVLFLIRDFPKKTSLQPYDWSIALAGTWLPLMLRPQNTGDIFTFLILQAIGLMMSIIGYLSLNKSLGIVPAIRKIKTGGLYRLVRHPIYLAYIIAYGSFFAQNMSIFNGIILILIITFDVLRIIAEEKFLNQSSDYLEYTKKVKWRLVPWVW